MYLLPLRCVQCSIICLVLQAACGVAQSAPPSDFSEELPKSVAGIDVLNQVGDFVPLELEFRDDTGRVVRLKDYFQKNKIVVLTLNYSDCPGLCMAQLENLVGTLRQLECKGLGENYEMLSVSIDPREDTQKASRTKNKYLGLLGNDQASSAWHFLVGNQPEITALAKSVGFNYTYDKANDRFNHPAVTYFISPNGRICRYFLDLGIEPNQFRLAVAEAAEGKLARSLAETFVQLCYYYDPDANRYSASAKRILAIAGGTFAIMLLGCLAPFWFSSRSKAVVISTSGNENN